MLWRLKEGGAGFKERIYEASMPLPFLSRDKLLPICYMVLYFLELTVISLYVYLLHMHFNCRYIIDKFPMRLAF